MACVTMMRMWHVKKRKKRRKRDYIPDTCDCVDCDIPCCDFSLLSTSMLLVARAERVPRSQRVAVGAIKGYRRFLSPRVPVTCRYEPSCSTYGLAAVEKYGTGKGLRLAAARLRRCRPGVPYGTLDPVP